MSEDELSRKPSEEATAECLWSNTDRTRQFSIPEALQLPPGEFVLRTGTGREQRVDPTALVTFEVSAEQAQAWAKAQLGEAMRQLGRGLREAVFGSGSLEKYIGGEGDEQSGATPGLDLLADITSTPRERFDGDDRAVGRALRDYLKNVAETAADARSGEGEREAAARRRVRGWAEILREHGISTPEIAEPEATPGDQQAQRPLEAEPVKPEIEPPKGDSEAQQ